MGWSPVIISTLMPALLHDSIASVTNGFGGSIMASNPQKTKPSVGKFCCFTEYSTLLAGIYNKPKPNTYGLTIYSFS